MDITNQTKQSKSKAQVSNEIRYITRVGILSAIAFIIMTFEFPIFPAAPYLKMDLSDVIALFGGVALGPVAAIIIEGIKNILNFMLHSTTGGIGEVANFLVGTAYIIPIIIIYRKFSNNKGLVSGLFFGTIIMVGVAGFANYFLLLPLYMPSFTSAERIDIILKTFVPFNLIKAVIQSVLTIGLLNGFKGVLKHIKIAD